MTNQYHFFLLAVISSGHTLTQSGDGVWRPKSGHSKLDRNAQTGPVYSEKAAPWTHSTILGWASNGNPLYGPFGYSAPPTPTRQSNPSSPGSVRAASLWSLSQHSGVSQMLNANNYGPKFNAKLPLGRYVEASAPTKPPPARPSTNPSA